MLKNLSTKNEPRRSTALSRLATATVLLLMFAVSASAYTLVFRSGIRMQIPDEFTLTKTTLTYEISPGFNKTFVLSLIDVAATERANREAPGSFFKRREQPPVVAVEPSYRAVKTLTNIDLESVRQRRVESEQAYEARRKQLGLPTVAETRRRQDDEAIVLRAQIRADAAAKAQEEMYWRGRARDLRAEIAAVDTQINYLRGRVNELSQSSLEGLSWTEVYPLWPNNRPWLSNGQWGVYPNWRLPGYRPARPGYGGMGYPYGYPPNPFGNSDRSQQKSDLTYRLDDLLVRRAGLAAQWRLLEDEARDARVPQVWLEP